MKMWFKFKPTHRHVFDTDNGIDRYGNLVVLQCACGVARVFGAAYDYLHPKCVPVPARGSKK